MDIPLSIDRRSSTPVHAQIYGGLRNTILASRLGPGDRIPSTRELAAVLGIARGTVSVAYDRLIGEGYVEPVAGAGTFVCRSLPNFAERARHGRNGVADASAKLSTYAGRLQAPLTRRTTAKGVVNLSKLSPAVDEFPLGLWKRLLGRRLRTASDDLLDYSEHSAGYPPLRAEIARYLSRARGVSCSSDQIIVVNSSQQALDLCARVLLDVGDRVVVEDPGYDAARDVFIAHGAKLLPIRVTPRGWSIADLPRRARLAYLTPSHQFPCGVSLTVAQRLAVIEWASAAGAVLLEDDYDSEFRYEGPPLPAMQGLSEHVPIIFVGTFSKVMFPGLRIGYLVAPHALVEPLLRAKRLSDRHTTMLEQAALADFIREGHLARHIRRMRRLYQRRRSSLLQALAQYLPRIATAEGEAAGLHVLVRLAGRLSDRVIDRCGVSLIRSSAYYLSAAPASANEFVMGFSALDEPTLVQGIRRLAEALTPIARS